MNRSQNESSILSYSLDVRGPFWTKLEDKRHQEQWNIGSRSRPLGVFFSGVQPQPRNFHEKIRLRSKAVGWRPGWEWFFHLVVDRICKRCSFSEVAELQPARNRAANVCPVGGEVTVSRTDGQVLVELWSTLFMANDNSRWLAIFQFVCTNHGYGRILSPCKRRSPLLVRRWKSKDFCTPGEISIFTCKPSHP